MAYKNVNNEENNNQVNSNYGRKLYFGTKKASLKKENKITMAEIEKFMNSIANLESPLKEEAFVSFCLGSKARTQCAVSQAA